MAGTMHKSSKASYTLRRLGAAVWLGLTEEEQSDYSVTVSKLKTKLAPMGFSSLEAFHTQKLQPGEALSLFLQESYFTQCQTLTGRPETNSCSINC